MDHQTSVATHAMERYFNGELAPAERDAFERHYFECAECAEDVAAAAAFTVNMKAVVRESPDACQVRREPGVGRDWFAWMRFTPAAVPVAACLALAAFTGYQNAVLIPHLRAGLSASTAAQAVSSAVLVPSTRGDAASIPVSPAARYIHLTLEVISGEAFDRYECELRSASGRTLERVPVPAPDESGTISIIVPSRDFEPGTYEAVLIGRAGSGRKQLERYRFAVREPRKGGTQVQAIP